MGKLSEYKKTSKGKTASQSPFSVNGLFGASTYAGDVRLFKELGLKPFKNISGDLHVGDVTLENKSKVKIWVYAAPALFWKFEIFDAENGKTTIASTGSGTLATFWPLAKLMAENMFVIDEVK